MVGKPFVLDRFAIWVSESLSPILEVQGSTAEKNEEILPKLVVRSPGTVDAFKNRGYSSLSRGPDRG